MEFLLVFTASIGAAAPDRGGMAEMTEFAAELARQGKLRRGAPLAPEVSRVRVRAGNAVVSDGPFAESKELIGGFWLIDVASRAEAIDVARRTPHARAGSVEVHSVSRRYTSTRVAEGTPFLLAFRMEPGLSDPDGAKLREMLDFMQELERSGKFLETAPLASDPPPARIEVQRGRRCVTDGPFAEAKEAIGGYGLVTASGRAEAIEIAKRTPHARWGPVEVREILFFDRV